VQSFGFYYGRNDTVILRIVDTPWWWETAVSVANKLCEWTGHHMCAVVFWSMDKAYASERYRMEVPATKEQWLEWAKLAGAKDPSWQWTGEDEDDE
jgi:hypothetical protein